MPAIARPMMETSPCNRAVEVVEQAARLAHDARMLKTLATDAVEDGVHAARRAMTRGTREYEDLRDAAIGRVRRAPLGALALAAGAGLLLGMALGRLRRRPIREVTP